MQALQRQLGWLIGIRIVVIASITLPTVLYDQFVSDVVTERYAVVVQTYLPGDLAGPPEPPEVRYVERRTEFDATLVYYLALFTAAATLLYLLLFRLLRRRPQVHAYVQFMGDLVLVTWVVYTTGGITSPFSLLYLVVIGVASALLRRRAGFWVATIAYLLYSGLLLLLFNNELPPPRGLPVEDVAWGRLGYNLTANLIGFYGVAALVSLLAHRTSRAERELEEKREDLADLQVLHRDVIQSITSGLATTDLRGRITSLNRAGEEILGRGEVELVGRPVQEILGVESWRQLTGAHDGAADADGPPTADGIQPLRQEVELEGPDGAMHVGFSLSPLTDATGTRRGWNLVFQDFTAWRRLEEEVRMKDRMAAVGELAAGIAHEIGNPLAAISGSVQMLAAAPDGDPAQRKLLDILSKESQRLDRTIKGFLRFARPAERATEEFDVAHLLAENFELLKNSPEVAPEHRLELSLDPPSVSLVADPDQVSQIFWNLARNALRAMPDGGRLRVEGTLAGDVYRFAFHDSGRGMTEEQRSKLFHPFQSFFDAGTGIGMAIVYRIVEEHGGRLGVDSGEGKGTSIVVDLPVRPVTGGLPRLELETASEEAR